MRHVITGKNYQRIIVVHVRDSHVSAFERGPNSYCPKLRSHGGAVKLSTPFKRAVVEM